MGVFSRNLSEDIPVYMVRELSLTCAMLLPKILQNITTQF